MSGTTSAAPMIKARAPHRSFCSREITSSTSPLNPPAAAFTPHRGSISSVSASARKTSIQTGSPCAARSSALSGEVGNPRLRAKSFPVPSGQSPTTGAFGNPFVPDGSLRSGSRVRSSTVPATSESVPSPPAAMRRSVPASTACRTAILASSADRVAESVASA